jgi:hypothetical protein
LYYTALYCIILHCLVLYCIALHCIVLYSVVLYCTVLHCTMLYYIILQYYGSENLLYRPTSEASSRKSSAQEQKGFTTSHLYTYRTFCFSAVDIRWCLAVASRINTIVSQNLSELAQHSTIADAKYINSEQNFRSAVVYGAVVVNQSHGSSNCN